MNKLETALRDISEMDRLAVKSSPVHGLSPLAKLLVTVAYIIVTVSFSKYQLGGLLMMIIYPLVMFSVSGISIGTCLYKLRIVLPLVVFVGLFNPIFDKAPMFRIGGVVVSSGVVSMITLMLKGVFCLMASFLL
ncbi:MAG: cobalt ECF transporter T component CbiQ, partial [Firmicutes bacterium]|nr:cobalt ECF transporter T component CbiQ [Bacillota bacterium]